MIATKDFRRRKRVCARDNDIGGSSVAIRQDNAGDRATFDFDLSNLGSELDTTTYLFERSRKTLRE
ncbi:MAG: hypothetical protein U0165_00730 [Polyangiaceae bacterium]